MKHLEYNAIIDFIEGHASKCSRTILSDLITKYKEQYPYHTLLSVFLNRLQRRLRASYHLKTKEESLKLYYKIYKQKVAEAQHKNESNIRVLINLAINFDLPPCLMARLVLEQHLLDEKLVSNRVSENVNDQKIADVSRSVDITKNLPSVSENTSLLQLSSAAIMEGNPLGRYVDRPGVVAAVPKGSGSSVENSEAGSQTNDNGKELSASSMENSEARSQNNDNAKKLSSNAPAQMSIKTKVSLWIKDPHLILDICLREQVLQCMSYDVCYGPINDAIRHCVGLEFEEKLKDGVKKLNLPFLDENDLRKRGYDKTPDVKLEVPIAVRGHPICWIESKASFGDLETHSEYLRGQYYSYWNRFGPGLVIYWFGFIEEISDEMLKRGIIVMDGFPNVSDITFMDP